MRDFALDGYYDIVTSLPGMLEYHDFHSSDVSRDFEKEIKYFM